MGYYSLRQRQQLAPLMLLLGTLALGLLRWRGWEQPLARIVKIERAHPNWRWLQR